MKDRIKKYMDYKSISAGELANLLEVQRSNISHVLNGRNKPGASFIEKFLISFPDLNARWLMTGEGEMIYKHAVPDINIAETKITPVIQTEKTQEKTTARINDKTIDKVVVLYADGTFIDYNKKI